MSVDLPIVSIVIPVYNGASYIVEALDSIFAQDFRSYEVVLVDDGSTDDTSRIVSQYKEIRYVRQDNRGVADARNRGVTVSRGEILVFLDADDIWPSDRLRVTTDYFEAHPEVGYVLGKQLMFVEPGCELPSWVNPLWLEDPQDAANTGTLAARRSTFDRVGLFSTHVDAEDTEWLVRASECGVPIARLPDIVLYRRMHDNNLSVQLFRNRRMNLLKIAKESIHRQRGRNRCS
jgi:glycosyltransferase involved in cell wall biosynthesis